MAFNAKMPAAEDWFKSDGSGLSAAAIHYLGNLEKAARSLNSLDESLPTDLAGKETLGSMRGINTQTGDYTPIITDKGKTIESNSGSDITITIPPDIFAANDWLNLSRVGSGNLIVAAGSGVTIRSVSSKLKLGSQNSLATIYCRAPNDFVLGGDLKA